MHYLCIAVIPRLGDVERAVDALLAPHREDEKGNGFWDWFQIGGRWTGILDKEYDPDKDPANQETCWLCNGTGKRTDGVGVTEGYGCNGCITRDENGKITGSNGVRIKWPTQWRQFDGDVVPLERYLALWAEEDSNVQPYTLMAEGVEIHNSVDTPNPQAAMLEALNKLPMDSRVVVIDYHC